MYARIPQVLHGRDVRKELHRVRVGGVLERVIERVGDHCVRPSHVSDETEKELFHLEKTDTLLHSVPMDIAARRDDPAVDEMARSIFTMFPRCMRCGEPIAHYEEADVRVLTHRV